jgi:hypothetical protein
MIIGNLPEVVSREEWLAARRRLQAEGEGTHPGPSPGQRQPPPVVCPRPTAVRSPSACTPAAAPAVRLSDEYLDGSAPVENADDEPCQPLVGGRSTNWLR